jgi:hypothetical protein
MSKTKVTGRGDGSLIGKKATQMAIFCKKQMEGAVSSQAVYPFSFGRKEGSKGAVSIMVRVYDMTLCCINCHLAANALPKRQVNPRDPSPPGFSVVRPRDLCARLLTFIGSAHTGTVQEDRGHSGQQARQLLLPAQQPVPPYHLDG